MKYSNTNLGATIENFPLSQFDPINLLPTMMTINTYLFTNDWFSSVKPLFRSLFTSVQIESVLEIGCFEGRGTFLEHLSSKGLKQLVCIDTWRGGRVHLSDGTDMESVYARFS